MESLSVSKLVANVPRELKEFVESQSSKREVSISYYVTELLEESKREMEREKSLEIFDKYKGKAAMERTDSVEEVRTLREKHLHA